MQDGLSQDSIAQKHFEHLISGVCRTGAQTGLPITTGNGAFPKTEHMTGLH